MNKIGIKDDKRCTFCKSFDENIIHLFYECEHVKDFWQSVISLIKNKCPHVEDLSFSKEDIIFGVKNCQKTDTILNLILLVAKRYIYTCRYRNSELNLLAFKRTLLFYYNTEKYIDYSVCDWEKFNKRWSLYESLLES